MSIKSLLIALLLAWLAGSVWWQTNKIMKCSTTEAAVVNSDSVALADSIAALQASDSDSVVKDSVVLETPTAGITEDDLAQSEKFSNVFKPMNLYFHTNDANYIKTDDNQKFLSEAKSYLAEHKDKTLSLTGHTDSDGADDANMKLSQLRAGDVKKQLIAKGFSAEQLSTEAKGETQPVSSNDTPEGKKANRRVTIVVNQ